MVVVDAPHGDSAAAAAAAELFTGDGDLQAFLDNAALEVTAEGGNLKEDVELEEELEWLSNKDAFPAVETMAPAAARRSQPQQVVASSATGRWCRHCGMEKTPIWRNGPEGRRTLCNACGVRYRTGKLLPEYRPLASPTFRPELHSNQHRRVVEMRRRLGKSATARDGEDKKGGEELISKDALRPALVGAMAFFPGTRPRTTGLRRPRRAVAWSNPPPRTPVSGGSATAIHLWRTSAAQRLAASAAAPIAGGAPRDEAEVGLGVSTGGLVMQPPADFPLMAPAPAVGPRRCGRRQAPAAPGPRLCWNCGAEQKPPAPAPKPATGKRQCCRPSGTKEAPLAHETKPTASAGQRRCEPRETKKTPRAPAAKPATAAKPCAPIVTKNTPQAPAAKPADRAGQLPCEPRETKKTPRARAEQLPCEPRATNEAPQVPAAKPRQPSAVRQLLCEHSETKKTRRAPAAKLAATAGCRHCGTAKTPQWRQGPDGPRTLCNACGVRYRAGCLVPEYRPLNSPSFSPELHSNLRRRVAEMYRACPAADGRE